MFNLPRHEDRDLLFDFGTHRSRCAVCGQHTRVRGGCPEGRRLHELLVLDAQARRPPWYERIDLAELPTERMGVEYLRAARDAATVEGVDASVWQGAFPWTQLPGLGIGLGIAKATEGNGFTDPQWGASVAALLGQSAIVGGSYHFSREDLGNTAMGCATWYLSRHPAPCFDPAVPWVFSLDSESSGGSAGWVYAWLDTVSNRIGYSSWFYSYASWISSRGIHATNRPLWIAWPNTGPPPNEGWPVVTMQQYGTRAIGGGQVDADRFFGNRATLLTLAGIESTPPAPPVPAAIPKDEDMGEIAFVDLSAQTSEQGMAWVDAAGSLWWWTYDQKTGTKRTAAIVATGLAPRTAPTLQTADSASQLQLAARMADGTVMHMVRPYTNGAAWWSPERYGSPDGGMPADPGFVAALASALAPQIPALDLAKLEADLKATMPALDAAAALNVFRAQIDK